MAAKSSRAAKPESPLSLSHNVFFLFAAGAISVLVFHQGMWSILHLLGMGPAPFPFAATKPLGVPVIWSFVFWGGIWGIVFGAVEKYFPPAPLYWVAAFLFGAIVPTLVVWFVVFPLKGIPLGGGWVPVRMLFGVLVHGAWGLGTALVLRWRP